MKIGFPTHPRRDIIDEIKWIGKNQFEFADLFFEADKAEYHNVDPVLIRQTLDDYGLDAVGHTAWYFAIGSPSKEIREKAVELIKKYVVLCSKINCKKVTVHANWPCGMFTAEEGIQFQTESLKALSSFAVGYGVKIIYEATDTPRDSKNNIRQILQLNPEIDFHADLGHLNLFGKDPLDCLIELKNRLSHIHMHDNNKLSDLHLPIGVGNIDWDKLIKNLKTFYNGTITLELFCPDKDYVLLSKKKLREKWDRASA